MKAYHVWCRARHSPLPRHPLRLPEISRTSRLSTAQAAPCRPRTRTISFPEVVRISATPTNPRQTSGGPAVFLACSNLTIVFARVLLDGRLEHGRHARRRSQQRGVQGHFLVPVGRRPDQPDQELCPHKPLPEGYRVAAELPPSG